MSVNELLSAVLKEAADAIEGKLTLGTMKVGLTLNRNETGPRALLEAARMATEKEPRLEVLLIGPEVEGLKDYLGDGVKHYPTGPEDRDIHETMEKLLQKGTIDAAVTMHYNFPLGTATVGRVITPGLGREMFLATTTGTMAADRVEAMVKAAIAGIAAAKACGISNPRVGILNLDGARACERSLQRLKERGYNITFAESIRKDGGFIMRGNDLLAGAADVMVTDSLTGNVLMKVFSAYTTGGNYESLGYGYGPGLGETYNYVVCIVSRASGTPVVAGALLYAAQAARGKVVEVFKKEMQAAKAAGLEELFVKEAAPEAAAEVTPPPAKAVEEEIPGIDVLELENAVKALWAAGIYAESGMGCTGPVALVAREDKERAIEILKEKGYL